MKRLLIAMAAMIVMSNVAQAQDIKFYAGTGLGAFGLELKAPGVSQKNTVFGGYAKFGADFNEFVGAELRIGTTANGSTSYPGGVITLSGDSIFSYFLKLQYPVAQDFRLYGLIGGTTAKMAVKINAPLLGLPVLQDSATQTGFSYGAGGEYFVSDQISIGAEWVQYWTNVNVGTSLDAKIWSATGTLSYHF